MTAAETWDEEVDLIVAGAGPGGMATALVAALEGLKVCVFEKSGQVGGTASTSAGTLWVPGNSQNRKIGFEDSPEGAAKYLDSLIGSDAGLDARQAYLATGPTAIDYYEANSDVKFLPCGKHPDYRSNIAGAAVTGRAIVPVPFDGRILGKEFRRVRPPIGEFMLLGGMMAGKDDIPKLINRFKSIGNFAHVARIVLRYAADRLRYPRGTRVMMGNALIARLFHSLRQKGVSVRYNAPIKAVLRDGDGRVAGAEFEAADGPLRVKARRGVVLATGGIGHNKEFREAFMPSPTPLRSMACETVTGDGLSVARSAGAKIDSEGHRRVGLWSPVSVTAGGRGMKGLYPHLALDRAKPGLIAVNSAGRRFVNEGASYHDFVEGMYDSDATVPSIPAYLVCDSAFVVKYGLGLVYPGTRDLGAYERQGYLKTGRTLAELAAKIGVDAEGLEDSVRRNNEYARTGEDLDFGKGENEVSRFNGDASVTPNPCLGPISKPPFVAMEVMPSDIACSAGLATDRDARVLAEDGTPIDGLYACGNDMASVMRGTYPGPGTTLGPALVFGYRAAMHAAGKPVG